MTEQNIKTTPDFNSRTLRSTRVIAITSGKGGVGKTNVTVNLAIALARMGQKVMIFDADMGLANVDIMLGIKPVYNISHVILGDKTLAEIIVEGPDGIKIIPASSGVEMLANLKEHQRLQFIKAFQEYQGQIDILFIDTSAGISENVMGFVAAADEAILVTTPEPTAITDAYALIKLVARAGSKKSLGLLLNRARSTEEAQQLGARLKMLAKKFLNFDLVDYGFLFEDASVSNGVRKQTPFIINSPASSVSRGIKDLAHRVLRLEVVPEADNTGLNRFLKKVAAALTQKRPEELN